MPPSEAANTGLVTLGTSTPTIGWLRLAARPVADLGLPIRVEDRTGDTKTGARQRQRPPMPPRLERAHQGVPVHPLDRGLLHLGDGVVELVRGGLDA